MELTPIQSLLNQIGQFVSLVIGEWVPIVIDTIIDHPLLIIYVAAIPVVGIAVGVFNRLVRSN